jgi:hypothetical protein
MGGGYAIPEFGLAYVRDIRFVDKETGKDRKADMLVSACYCLFASPQLYANPTTTEQVNIQILEATSIEIRPIILADKKRYR